MALSVDIKASGQTQLIGDTMACSFSSDGKLKQTYTYNKTLSHYDNSFDKGAALILTDAGGSVTNTAVVLGSDGAEKTSKQVGSVVKGLSCDGSHLLLLSDEKVVYYDLSLANPKTKGCSADAQSAVLIGGKRIRDGEQGNTENFYGIVIPKRMNSGCGTCSRRPAHIMKKVLPRLWRQGGMCEKRLFTQKRRYCP